MNEKGPWTSAVMWQESPLWITQSASSRRRQSIQSCKTVPLGRLHASSQDQGHWNATSQPRCHLWKKKKKWIGVPWRKKLRIPHAPAYVSAACEARQNVCPLHKQVTHMLVRGEFLTFSFRGAIVLCVICRASSIPPHSQSRCHLAWRKRWTGLQEHHLLSPVHLFLYFTNGILACVISRASSIPPNCRTGYHLLRRRSGSCIPVPPLPLLQVASCPVVD